MGLDMYLIKKKKNSNVACEDMEYEDWKNNEVAYWRKANQIHRWLVNNVQDGVDDCKYYLVKKEKIEELKSICDRILKEVITGDGKIQNGMHLENNEWVPDLEDGKVILNKELCEELLPTQDGFFFGSTDYDEYYLKDIKETSEMLDEVLKGTDFENEEIYYSSRW